ncbi:hypothetical protein JW933_10125 [candidate division FCPU426 bacterium]|nr:hypothetical protein [candidate division FCPU426 bacterium]
MKRAMVLLGVLAVGAAAQAAEDYSFEVPAVASEKETFELGGNLDAAYTVFKSRKGSPLYALQYDGLELSGDLSSYRMELYLNGDYQTKDAGLRIRTYTEYYSDILTAISLYELYGSLNLSENSFLILGKKMYNWGKGYAFNPVGYVNPKKEPEDPELSQAGLLSMNYEYSKSFSWDYLKNMSLTIIAVSPEPGINDRLFELRHADWAGKLYLLLWDTDIDFMGYYSNTQPGKIGLDFSKNIYANLEIHGEYGRFKGQSKYSISDDGLQTGKHDGATYLLGFRWLNEWNLTVVAEYYHNSAGLTRKEFQNYAGFLRNAADLGNTSAATALNVNRNYFSGNTLLCDYFYLKLSWPEPFHWIYFTPAFQIVYNIEDKSASISIPVSYKPMTNVGFLFWPTFLTGGEDTEFGSKPYEMKLEMCAGYYF